MLTVVTKIESNEKSFGSQKILNNKIVGKRIATVPALQAEMTLDRESSPTWVLNTTQAAAFSQDLMAIVDETFPFNVKFFHIQCHQYVESVGDVEQPIRFNLSIDGVALGAMSQFQLGNCDNFAPNQIVVSGIAPPTGKRAVLSVIIGIDN